MEIVDLLRSRGVEVKEIAEIVRELQRPYSPRLTLLECVEAVKSVISKREVQYAIMTGIALDILAEQKKLPYPLQEIIEKDEPLYGMDEVLAFGITNMYGTIGITNFGFLDKQKAGIIGQLNANKKNHVNTFLDDLVAAIAAAASAKIAHQERKNQWPV
ncbi:MAG: phosphatidylglycerophosphatase A family protein [Thermincolia bacterium]